VLPLPALALAHLDFLANDEVTTLVPTLFSSDKDKVIPLQDCPLAFNHGLVLKLYRLLLTTTAMLGTIQGQMRIGQMERASVLVLLQVKRAIETVRLAVSRMTRRIG
jgi:hypothetical protein